MVNHLTALVLLYLDYEILFSENRVDPNQLAPDQDSVPPIFLSVKNLFLLYVQTKQQGADLHLHYPPIWKS